MVKQLMVNSDFYANNVATLLSDNTNLTNGKGHFFRNIFLVSRLLGSLQGIMVKVLKPYRNTLITIQIQKTLSQIPSQ
jgi:hypothetical protein